MADSQGAVANWLLEHPLIFRFPMSKRDGIRLISDYRWRVRPGSACWMCPNLTNTEWRDERDNFPADFSLAVELDHEMRKTKPEAFLHQPHRGRALFCL